MYRLSAACALVTFVVAGRGSGGDDGGDATSSFWHDGHTATRYTSPSGTPFEFWEHDDLAPTTR